MKALAVLTVLVVPGAALATGPYPEELDGRMTGGGKYKRPSGTYVTHGFEIHCNLAKPNNIQVNWKGHRFHLTELTSAQCTDDPNINPLPRSAPFDTFRGQGTGRYDGEDGATIDFKFTDGGEPGRRDTIRIMIWDKDGDVVLGGHGAVRLKTGNHQAHPNNKPAP